MSCRLTPAIEHPLLPNLLSILAFAACIYCGHSEGWMVCLEMITFALAFYAALCNGSLTKRVACADEERRKDTNDFWDLRNYLTKQINSGEKEIATLKKHLEEKEEELQKAKTLAETNRKLANMTSCGLYAAEDQLKSQAALEWKLKSVNRACSKVTSNLAAEREDHVATKAQHVKEMEAQEQKHISAIKDVEEKLRSEQEGHKATKQQRDASEWQAKAAFEEEISQAYNKAYRDLLRIRAIHGKSFDNLQADCEAKKEEVAHLQAELQAARAKTVEKQPSHQQNPAKTTQVCPNCGHKFGAQVSGSRKSHSKPSGGAQKKTAGKSAGAEKTAEKAPLTKSTESAKTKDSGGVDAASAAETTSCVLSGLVFPKKLPELGKDPEEPAVKKSDDVEKKPVRPCFVEDDGDDDEEEMPRIPKKHNAAKASATPAPPSAPPQTDGDLTIKCSSGTTIMHGCPIHRPGRKPKFPKRHQHGEEEKPCCALPISDEKLRQGPPPSVLKTKRRHEEFEVVTAPPAKTLQDGEYTYAEEDAPREPSLWSESGCLETREGEKRVCGARPVLKCRKPGERLLGRSCRT